MEVLTTDFRDAVLASVPRTRSRSDAFGDLPPRILGFIRERNKVSRTFRRLLTLSDTMSSKQISVILIESYVILTVFLRPIILRISPRDTCQH